MTQRHLGETKAGERLPASPGGGGEGRKRFAVPKAKPTPALRLGPASELGVAPGRSGGPTCDTRPPPSPPPSGGRAAPRGSQPEGPPLPAERGQAGPRPRRRERSTEQTEPSRADRPIPTRSSAPLCANSPGPAAVRPRTHTAQPQGALLAHGRLRARLAYPSALPSALRTRGSQPPAPLRRYRSPQSLRRALAARCGVSSASGAGARCR